MKRNGYMVWLVVLALSGGVAASTVYETGGLAPRASDMPSEVYAEVWPEAVLFTVADARVSFVQLKVMDRAGELVYSSGLVEGTEVYWDYSWQEEATEQTLFVYQLRAWDELAQEVGGQMGLLDVAAEKEPLLAVLKYDEPGDFTIGGFLGVGTENPERAVHIQGVNAVFRMDRDRNSAAFMLVRTDGTFNEIWKTYVVGVDATGPNQGQFVINDLGAAVGGGGARRMTIDTKGDVQFTGDVQAANFYTPSSAQFKTDIAPLVDALAKVCRLNGVRFTWKETGEPAIGFIAEEVARVFPELVRYDESDQNAQGLDYGKLTAVLVEAAKAQQAEIEALEAECAALKARWSAQLAALTAEKQAAAAPAAVK